MAFVFIRPGISHALEPEKLGQGIQMMTGLVSLAREVIKLVISNRFKLNQETKALQMLKESKVILISLQYQL